MFEPQPGKSCAFYLSTTCLFDSSYLLDKAAQPSTTFFSVITIGRRFCPGTRLKLLRHSQGVHQYFLFKIVGHSNNYGIFGQCCPISWQKYVNINLRDALLRCPKYYFSGLGPDGNVGPEYSLAWYILGFWKVQEGSRWFREFLKGVEHSKLGFGITMRSSRFLKVPLQSAKSPSNKNITLPKARRTQAVAS